MRDILPENNENINLKIQALVCRADSLKKFIGDIIPMGYNENLNDTTKRTNHAHKNHFEFVKTGKISSIGIRCSIQETTCNIPSSSIRTAHRLIRLGKLII